MHRVPVGTKRLRGSGSTANEVPYSSSESDFEEPPLGSHHKTHDADNYVDDEYSTRVFDTARRVQVHLQRRAERAGQTVDRTIAAIIRRRSRSPKAHADSSQHRHFHPPKVNRRADASPTLRALLGAPMAPFELSAANHAALIIIDAQNTYTRGVMKLEGVEDALQECRTLLSMARRAGVPVIHVQHDGGKGSPYDVTDDIGAICPIVAPKRVRDPSELINAEPAISQKKKRTCSSEFVVVKKQTSSFVDTNLEALLQGLGAKNLLICGFMTHCCIESTTRDAAHKGYNCVVVGAATATRSLADPVYFSSEKFSLAKSTIAVTSADELKRAALTALSDAFALVVPAARDIPVAE